MFGELNVKPELHNVAVAHDVFFAFDAQLARLTSLGFGAESGEVIKMHDLSSDEAALEVAMNDARSLWSFHAFGDGPGTGFFFARGQVSLKAEQGIHALDEQIHAAIVHTEIGGRSIPGLVRVPRRAFAKSDRVLVVSDGHMVTTRPVKVLRTEKDDVLVSEGIADGEQICVTALTAVIEGMEVKVVSRDGKQVNAAPEAP